MRKWRRGREWEEREWEGEYGEREEGRREGRIGKGYGERGARENRISQDMFSIVALMSSSIPILSYLLSSIVYVLLSSIFTNFQYSIVQCRRIKNNSVQYSAAQYTTV